MMMMVPLIPWMWCTRSLPDKKFGRSFFVYSGMIHFDVKPANVMLVRKNDLSEVRLIDYGLASPRNIKVGMRGSMQYMSHERVANDPANRKDDFYSVGVTLLEMLTKDDGERGQLISDIFRDAKHQHEVFINMFRADKAPADASVVTRFCFLVIIANRYRYDSLRLILYSEMFLVMCSSARARACVYSLCSATRVEWLQYIWPHVQCKGTISKR